MSVRPEDPPIVKITREIPLPWLLAGAAAFIFNTAQSWQQTEALKTKLTEQAEKVEKLTEKIERTNVLVSADGSVRAQKDNEHDIRIQSLTNRVTALEAAMPRYLPPEPLRRTR